MNSLKPQLQEFSSKIFGLASANWILFGFGLLGLPTLSFIAYLLVSGAPLAFIDPVSVAIFFLGAYFNAVLAALLGRLLVLLVDLAVRLVAFVYITARIGNSLTFRRIKRKSREVSRSTSAEEITASLRYLTIIARGRLSMRIKVEREVDRIFSPARKFAATLFAGTMIFALLFAGPYAFWLPLIAIYIVVVYSSIRFRPHSLLLPILTLAVFRSLAEKLEVSARKRTGQRQESLIWTKIAWKKRLGLRILAFRMALQDSLGSTYRDAKYTVQDAQFLGVLLAVIALILGTMKYYSDISVSYEVTTFGTTRCLSPLLQMGGQTAFYDQGTEKIVIAPISETLIEITTCQEGERALVRA